MKRMKKLLLVLAVMMMMTAGTALTASAAVKIPAIKPGERIQKVKTLAWNAKLKANVRTKYGKYKAGKTVKVLSTGSTCIIRLKGKDGKNHKYKIARKYLYLTDALVTSKKGDYNTSTKIRFVNKTKRTSKTKYFIWVSLDKQRVNVYQGKSRKWKLVRVMKCSTGVGAATPVGTFTIDFKEPEYEYLTYYLEYSGSGFHMWPGVYPNMKKTLGRDVASHGCIRLTYSDSKWMYKKIPVGTRVLIY